LRDFAQKGARELGPRKWKGGTKGATIRRGEVSLVEVLRMVSGRIQERKKPREGES